MFLSARDSSINKGIKENSTIESLREHLIRTSAYGESQFITIQEGVIDNFTILGLGDGTFITPKPFVHPVIVEHENHRYMIIDVRTCARYNKQEQIVKITNPSLFRREIIRAVLESVWVNDGSNDILHLGAFQIQVFAKWVSEVITRRYGLDAEQQLQVQVISAFYYICLFTDSENVDLRRFIAIITRATKTNTTFILDTLRDVDYIPNVEGLLATIREQLVTERLDGLELDVFITMLAGSWFGPNHGILVGTALEYPPLWCTLVYLSLTESVNRATGIGKVALRFERDPTSREFLGALNLLLMNNTTIDIKNSRG